MNAVISQPVWDAQKRFDETYITSSEICERLGVTRVALHVRKKGGHLPGGIMVNNSHLLIWERSAIEPHIVRWEEHLNKKRGH